MDLLRWYLVGLAAGLVALDAATTFCLWRSGSYSSRQKSAQTCLLWIVPGMAVVVLYLLNDRRKEPERDPTVWPPESRAD